MTLAARMDRLKRKLADRQNTARFASYAADPQGYCESVLGVRLTPDQRRIVQAAVTPPRRVLAPSGHNVGKSFVAACLVNWWFDTRRPGICLTTAPTYRQVCDILWKEVRRLRTRAGLDDFAGPRIPRLETAGDHYALGFTATDSTAFQGQHEAAVMVIFDEAEGVPLEFWEAADTMLTEDSVFLATYNPTTGAGPTVEAERSPGYDTVNCSAVNHPNIRGELEGKGAPFPAAVRLSQLLAWCEKWATKLPPGQPPAPTDFQVGADWYRPSPVGEARILGRRPSAAYNAVFPAFLFDLAERRSLPDGGPLQIGCDVARYGDDHTAWHVRRGGVSLHHESVNGWSVPDVADRTKGLAREWAIGGEPRLVPLCVDDSGVGGGVTDLLRQDRYAAVGINSACKAPGEAEAEYPNLRSCLWFGLADAALAGNVSFARLPPHVRADLRRELTAPVYTLDVRGRRVVEPKDVTKRRVGRSPDNADACLLAYCNLGLMSEQLAGRVWVP